MEIRTAEFVTSMADYGAFPGKGLPQIAVAGKSNVGKSTLINRLCRRNKLARTSSTPGKTRLLNVFLINGEFHLVDLPGYGFAKVDKQEKLRWGKMMQDYFSGAEELRHVLCLVDIRHEPTEDDRTMNRFLRETDIPFTVIATKADKISRGAYSPGKFYASAARMAPGGMNCSACWTRYFTAARNKNRKQNNNA